MKKIVLLAALLSFGLGAVALAGVVRIATRFGTLTLQRADDRVNFQGRVYFNGHALHPDVRGNNALYVRQTFQLAGADAVLFEDQGGAACPVLWYIVSVGPAGAASTPEFGSCGSLLGTAQNGPAIVVRTRGFLGPFEPQAARSRAAAETHVFLYRHGVVTENGKRVP
jgi:hypothetical protein